MKVGNHISERLSRSREVQPSDYSIGEREVRLAKSLRSGSERRREKDGCGLAILVAILFVNHFSPSLSTFVDRIAPNLKDTFSNPIEAINYIIGDDIQTKTPDYSGVSISRMNRGLVTISSSVGR